jgi:ATP-dependent exoDNAse (exonuclease V) alpha subunit
MDNTADGWLQRRMDNRRKRDRSTTYDDDWSAYEARGSSSAGQSSSGSRRGGFERQFATSTSASSSTTTTSLPRRGGGGGIEGEHHHRTNNNQSSANPYSRSGKQQQQGNATMTTSSTTMTNRYNNNNNNNTSSLPHIALHAEIAPSASLAAMGYNSNSTSNNSSSRIRIADYRGAAARIGTLPLMNNDNDYERNLFDSSNASNTTTTTNSSSSSSSIFQNANFLNSLNIAPTITVTLPQELRSSLNNEQCQVVESVLSGYSTFFTGPAGSGKSHILSTILRANNEGITTGRKTKKKIVVTATTGVAACNVGGITIHSFAGIGVGSGSYEEMAKRVMGNEYTKQHWRECDMLIIDEISMLGSSFLDKLNFIACRARNDRRPFGGVQLVVCGDFYQLPPVELNKE